MYLDFDNDHFKYIFVPDALPASEVAEIQCAKFNKEYKRWVLPPINASVFSLKRLYGEDIPLTKVAQMHYDYSNTVKKLDLKEFPLFEYQKEAADFLVRNVHRGLMLSLAPGLGKTLVSIAAANALHLKKVLVICPLILTRTWVDEIKRWSGKDTEIVVFHGAAIDTKFQWTITNYDSVVNHIDSYSQQNWDLVICDESILLKNRKTKRVKTIKKLTEQIPKIWLLSGSPVGKYADDLFSQLNIMSSNFRSYWKFVSEYCYSIVSSFGTQIVGTKKSINFLKEFNDIKFTRIKEQVLSDLPPMIFQTYSVDLNENQRMIYDQLEKEFIAELDQTGDIQVSVTNILSKMIRLQEITSNLHNLGQDWPFSSAKTELLLNLIECGELEEPVLIWVNWKATGLYLYQKINEIKPGIVGYIYGDTKISERETILSRFKNGELKYLVLSLEVGKFGLNLNEVQSVVYHDKGFNADSYYQSLERVSRIGQDHNVSVFSLVADRTVDKIINNNLTNKFFSFSKISGSEMKGIFESLKSG